MDPIECRGDAPLGRDHVRSTLQQPGRKARRHGIWLGGQLRGDDGSGSGISAEKRLQRPNRLFARQIELTRRVAVGADRRARDVDLLVGADAHLRAGLSQAHELLAVSNRPARDFGLQPGLGGQEPALGHERGHRLAGVLEIQPGGIGVGSSGGAAVSHPPPEVELPRPR